jgi:hypothetical protein
VFPNIFPTTPHFVPYDLPNSFSWNLYRWAWDLYVWSECVYMLESLQSFRTFLSWANQKGSLHKKRFIGWCQQKSFVAKRMSLFKD